jgi:hypothetical protein
VVLPGIRAVLPPLGVCFTTDSLGR